MPGFVCPAVGLLERTTELTITCVPAAEGKGEGEDEGTNVDRVRIEDKTSLSSRNVTETTLNGAEVEKATKTGRKRFMLSGTVETAKDTGAATAVVTCRLFQRGDGWHTRQERSLVRPDDADADADADAVKKKNSNASTWRLRERNVLVSPGKQDVVVDRFFTRVEDPPPAAATATQPQPDPAQTSDR